MTRGVDYIGVTVCFVCHDGQGRVLLQKRSQNARDERGRWDNGGGALEFGETFEDAVRREVKEEFGVEAQELIPLSVYNNLRNQDGVATHWVAIPYAVRVNPEEVKIGEPHKVDEIGWFAPDALPQPRHTHLETMVQMAAGAGIFSKYGNE